MFYASMLLVVKIYIPPCISLRRGSKNTQNYTKKIFMTKIINDGVITHLEPDILECEVKWALGSITTKLVEMVKFQLSYFKS